MAVDIATSASVAICGLLGQGINLCESAQCRREQFLTPLISPTLGQTFVIPARAEIAMLTIVALLSIRDAEAFAQFERQAMTIMAAHGGNLETAFRPSSTDLKQTPRVDEVHVLKFPRPRCVRTLQEGRQAEISRGSTRAGDLRHNGVCICRRGSLPRPSIGRALPLPSCSCSVTTAAEIEPLPRIFSASSSRPGKSPPHPVYAAMLHDKKQ